MGFWRVVGNIIQGKPAFENPENIGVDRTDVDSDEVVVPVRPGYDDKGDKIVPKILVSRCQSQTKADAMEVWAWIKNESAVPVRLEKVVIIGQSRQLGNFLTPGEQEQVMVYSGPRPRIDSYTKADFHYLQLNTNDYFNAEHQVEYDYQPDGTYLISELRPYNYIRDI